MNNLMSFSDKVTRSVGEKKAVNVAYQDFRKAFDSISLSVLLEKLVAYGLDGVPQGNSFGASSV